MNERETAQHPDEAERRLLPLDLGALALVALTLFLAPLMAGGFVSPNSTEILSTSETIGLPLVLILTAMATLLVVAREYKNPVALGTLLGVRESAVLLGIWGAVTLLFSPVRFVCWGSLFTLWAVLMIAGLTARLGRSAQAWSVLLRLMLLTGGVVAFWGIVEYFTKGMPQWRIFATFINPDFLAGYLLLLIPLSLATFVAIPQTPYLVGFGVLIIAQVMALFLTGSRAGIGALGGAVLVWVLLLAWGRILKPNLKPLGAGLLLCLVGGIIGLAPVRNRVESGQGGKSTVNAIQASASAQAHSGEFRKWTWRGTVEMAKSNLLFGTGIGSYELAYPRYTQTAFTAHAHNAYLQWAAEMGGLGVLLLFLPVASLCAFALHILHAHRQASLAGETEAFRAEPFGLFSEPYVLLTGFFASLVATLLHSLIDSDWYAVANAVTLAAVIGLMLSLARYLAPDATKAPAPLPKMGLLLGVPLALILVWQGSSILNYRTALTSGNISLQSQKPQDALADFQSASSALPYDPEAYLKQALILGATEHPQEAEQTLLTATRIAPCGRTFYRLAQFYVKTKQPDKAIAAYEDSRRREPRNVQNLRALGDCYREAHRNDDAKHIYEIVSDLEQGVYGRVRAMPEMIESEFGFAHIGLADIANESKQWEEAAKEYHAAVNVFGEYWSNRTSGYYLTVSPSKRTGWIEKYEYALTQWVATLKQQGAISDEIQKADKLRTDFLTAKAQEPPLSDGGGS